MLRLIPAGAFLILIGPVIAGLLGAALPAFGYLPTIGGEAFSFAPFAQLLAMPGLLRSCAISLCVGLAATATSFVVVTGFVAGWRDSGAFAAIERLVSPLLSVPHAAAAIALAFLIAPSGFLARLVSPWLTGWQRPPDLLIVHDTFGLSMTAGLVVKEIPFLLLVCLAAMPQARVAEFGRLTASLGYGRIAGFIFGSMPAVYAQIRLPVFAVLAYATSVVDVAIVLGPTTPPLLAVRVLQWHADPDLAMRFVAAAGALLQLAVTGLALLVWIAGERAAHRLCAFWRRSGRRRDKDGVWRRLALVAMTISTGLVLSGIAVLGIWSLAGWWRYPALLPDTLTLSVWMKSLPAMGTGLFNAALIGLAAGATATALALAALEHEARAGLTPAVRALAALYLPLLVPQIAFLLGLNVIFTWLYFDGRLVSVILIHLVFVFPYVLLSLSNPWRSWDHRYRLVANALGHGPDAVFWRVRLPMLVRPVLTAFAVGFAVSIGLYLPTLLIGAGRWPTITTEAVALASGGERRVTAAVALLQATLPFAGFAVALLVPALLFRHRRAMRPAR